MPPRPKLNFTFHKDFVTDKKTGSWLWYKSWNIPTLTVSLSLDPKNPDSAGLKLPRGLYAKIMAVKHVSMAGRDGLSHLKQCPDQPVFEEVGLLGETELPLFNGACTFSSLKFTATSFNHQSRFFHLAVVIFAPNCGSTSSKKASKQGLPLWQLADPVIVASKISTKVYVTSRKPSVNETSKVSASAIRSQTLPFQNQQKVLFYKPFDLIQVDSELFNRSQR